MLDISRPYGTCRIGGSFFSTNIQSLWDCPVRNNILVENKLHLKKVPLGRNRILSVYQCFLYLLTLNCQLFCRYLTSIYKNIPNTNCEQVVLKQLRDAQ